MKTKTTITIITLLGISFGLVAQVTDTGDKVGIGSPNPDSKLRIDDTFSLLRFDAVNGQFRLRSTRHTGYNSSDLLLSAQKNLILYPDGNGSAFSGGGNVGIGTITPTFKLDISGSSEGIKLGSTDSFLLFRNNIGQANEIRSYGLNLEIETRNSQDILFNSNNGYSTLMTIKGDGSGVGIGTINPNGWKLAVNGNIRAKEIKVETGWSDFVFYDSYKLPTLQEVENHIKEKGHLKDIPSAKEVEENGIFLGEMGSKLLQKIEELTLYAIQQQKEIKAQKEKIEKFEKENKFLKNMNKKLFELQKRLEKLENE